MSFGKRQPPSRTTVNQAVGPTVSRPVRTIDDGDDDGRKARSFVPWLIAIGFGAVAITFVASTYISTMRAVGKKLERDFEVEFSNAIRQTPRLALLKTPKADGWDFGSCTLKKSAEAMDRIYPSRTEHRRQMHEGMMGSAGGDQSDKVLKHADFLECVAQVESRNLCDAAIRQAFVTDVLAFYQEHQYLTANLVRSTNPNVDPKLREIMSNFERELTDMKAAQTSVDNELATAKETVDGALKSASRAGYLSSRDFGFFAPARAKENLVTPEPDAKPCT